MIELVSQSRCVACDVCVSVCPTNVFDAVPGNAPVIARREDCQTCFICEAHCPADALYVASSAYERETVDEAALVATNRLGHYRRGLGWGKGNSVPALVKELGELRDKVGSPY